ncbi:hypothetical protein PGQ11_013242 [Apiospora arundinis]|uniref:DUF7918 domain-containing protein n=1 Tax=Apiospora arundinis TaxID=335852 RepID=A0ABR2I7E3_9PEZI
MAVLNGLPGIGVVVRANGSLANEYPAPNPNPPRFAFRKCTSIYILSSDDVKFSVGLAVDELYDFSLDEDYQLRFRVTVDGDRLEAECMISKDQVAAGYGRAYRSLDKTTPSYDVRSGTSFVQKFRFPIIARGE